MASIAVRFPPFSLWSVISHKSAGSFLRNIEWVCYLKISCTKCKGKLTILIQIENG